MRIADCLDKISQNPRLCKFLIFIFYGIIVFLFVMAKYLYPKVFSFQLDEQISTIISIVYGIVGAFVAVMVPLHYSLSFNILGEIEDVHNNNKKLTDDQKEAERKLKNYCHTAEGLVYSFALFGVLVLLEGAFVIAKILKVNIYLFVEIHSFSLLRIGEIICYFLVLTEGMSHNLRRYEEWGLAEQDDGQVKYLKIYVISLLFSGIWGALLLVSDCHSLNAVIALILVIGYYFLWIFLRHLFAPLSHMKKLVIPNLFI